MTPLQEELLDLLDLLLSQISKDRVYKHIRTSVGEYEVFIEDTVTSLYFRVTPAGQLRNGYTVVDVERRSGMPSFASWKEDKAAAWIPKLRHHFILDMLASVRPDS